MLKKCRFHREIGIFHLSLIQLSDVDMIKTKKQLVQYCEFPRQMLFGNSLYLKAFQAIFGWLADITSIQYVFQLTAFLPLLGIVTYLLPNIKEPKIRN